MRSNSAETDRASGVCYVPPMIPMVKCFARARSWTAPRAPATAGCVLLAVALACGPRVDPVTTAEVRERDADARVLVFVRDRDGIPSCPWEVLGTVEVATGWTESPDERRRAERAAAELGGHALMVETSEDAEARILRFFDPLCNPARDE